MTRRPGIHAGALLIALTMPGGFFPGISPGPAVAEPTAKPAPRGTEAVACNPSGDLDSNGVVDCDDYAEYVRILGAGPGDPSYGMADLDCDGLAGGLQDALLLTALLAPCVPCGHPVALDCDGGVLTVTPSETTAEPGEWITFGLPPSCYQDHCTGNINSTRTRVTFPASPGLFPTGSNGTLIDNKCHFRVPLSAAPGRYPFTVGPYQGFAYNTPCPDVASNPQTHVLVIPCHQPLDPGPFKTSLYSISGVSGGHGWSWSLTSPDITTMGALTVAAVPTGGTAYQLAQAFATSINAQLDCPTNVVTAQAKLLAGTAYLAVTARGNNKPALCVGSDGQPAICCPSFAISTQCTFGGNVLSSDTFRPAAAQSPNLPVIEEIPTSELDCNSNGQDDTVDILFEESLDLNFDGIPDECQASGVIEQPLPFGRHSSTPNPFTTATRLNFELRTTAPVRAVIFDLLGRLVRDLSSGELPAGVHTLEWDGRSSSGEPVAGGIYVYSLESAGRRVSGRLALLR